MGIIGIIGAMEEEVSELKHKMQLESKSEKASMRFFKGKIEKTDVVVVQSGIGKVNAAVCAQILIDDFHVNTLINTGIAGGLKGGIRIGDIILSKEVLQHDMDVTAFGHPRGVIPGMKQSTFKGDERLLVLARQAGQAQKKAGIFLGKIVSGDQFISDQNKKEELLKVFHADCVEMEGAAIAQVAYLNHIPFLIMRAISDRADQEAQNTYEECKEEVIHNMVQIVLELVRKI